MLLDFSVRSLRRAPFSLCASTPEEESQDEEDEDADLWNSRHQLLGNGGKSMESLQTYSYADADSNLCALGIATGYSARINTPRAGSC
jgi:hypothetical protein